MPKESQSPEPVAPLLQILRGSVLAWAEQAGMARSVVARPGERALVEVQSQLPHGIQITRRKLKGRRISQKGPRSSSNRNINTAYWPEDGLRAKRCDTLICVVKGATDFPVGDLLLHCKEGDFIFVLAGTPHPDGSSSHVEEPNREQKDCSLLWLASAGAGNGLGCWICHSRGAEHFEKPSESCYLSSEQTLGLFNILMYQSDFKQSYDPASCSHLLRALLAMICHDLEEGNFYQFSRQMAEWSSATTVANPIERAQEYIRSQIHRRLTIDDVAKHVYLSRAQFTKLFRRESGKTFVEYVTECRIAEAKILLNNSEWSVSLICRAIGLTPSRFRSIFTEATGMGPAEYRRRCRTEALPVEKPASRKRK
jgi:AraC-like DNA-binding protein